MDQRITREDNRQLALRLAVQLHAAGETSVGPAVAKLVVETADVFLDYLRKAPFVKSAEAAVTLTEEEIKELLSNGAKEEGQ